MAQTVFLGLQHAALIFVLQVWLTWVLEFVPAGTRAQGTGVCVSSLLMVISGYLLGLREARRSQTVVLSTQAEALANPEASHKQRALALLYESVASWRTIPWSKVIAAALALALLSALSWVPGLAEAMFPQSTLNDGGIARAILGVDRIFFPAGLMIGVGVLLGVNARPWSLLAGLCGLGLFISLSVGAGYAARFTSYDPGVIALFTVVGTMASAIVTGFVLAWARKRLAFVEQSLVALGSGYIVYLIAAVGPASLTRASSLPDEQILLALSIFPAMAIMSLLAVGGSLGFLLFGGGRFDPGIQIETQVGLRYLRAHRRDGFVGIVTYIAVAGVCLGVMALIVVLSVMSGFENDLKQKILGAHAHIMVNKHGDDFTEYTELEKQIRQVDGINTAAAYVLGDGMISTDANLSGTVVKGINVADEAAVRELAKNVKKGQGKLEYLLNPEKIPGAKPRFKFPPPKTSTVTGLVDPLDVVQPAVRGPESGRRVLPGILIGRELSTSLRAYVGDVVKLVSPVSEEIGPLGPTPKLRRYRVAGVFYSGMYEYDAKFTYVSMKQAQRFFGMRGKATGVEIKVKDIGDTSMIVEQLKRAVGGYPYTVKDWRDMNKELFSALLLEKLAMFIALAMIVMVASFLIVATLVMIVLQRGKEIAILKSLGASDASIMKVFVVQGLIVGVGGSASGGVLGVGLCLLLERYGVSLDEKIFYIERLPVVMDWAEIGVIATAAMIISYLATIYPAMTAAQLSPVEGLRDD